MKKVALRLVSFITTVALIIETAPIYVFAQAVTFEQIVNASLYIIVYNEGTYTTVIKNDNGALSLGKICWHGTNALNLLKKIVALNPSQALNILGTSLYNEIVTASSWDTRKATASEASALAILLATAESHQVQDKSGYEYVSGYISLGQSLGITEAQALVFFADYANQNGRTGAANLYRSTKNTYGNVNLGTLYATTGKSSRRTRTYNFCATVNWNDYKDTPEIEDSVSPVMTNITVSEVTSSGFSVYCDITDNIAVTEVYFAVHHEDDGTDGIKMYVQNPENKQVSHTINISDFSNRAGRYYVYIYAFDKAGNYAYAVLNPINVPPAATVAEFAVSIFSNEASFIGDEIVWNASASSGSGHYLYQFTLYKDGKKIAERKYSDYHIFKYTADKTGIYSLEVNVYDSISGKSISCTSPDVNIYKPIIMQSFNTDGSKILTGQPVTWKIEASGGEGELQYAYTVFKNDEAVYSTSEYSKSTSFTYKPTESGIYYAVVNIKDSSSQVVSFKGDEITVNDPIKITDLRFSKNYAVAGMSVTCTADISGGTGTYSCVFDIYRNGVILYSEKSATNEFKFTIPSDGNYTAKVTITDTDSNTQTAEGGILTAESTAKRGDANCDGEITAEDARLALRHSAQLELIPEENQASADINNDGNITAEDARIILRISCGLE